ncbi:MAG: hypothetical protein JSR65_04290 [Proteobacteria bacterium]|nr:hypothetical protein [Pseudomonadota bacterium]
MEIQGHGARSSFAGSGSVLGTTYVITPSGSNKNIVTAIGPKGFFMQDTAGDNDVTTSDGIYVYLGVPPTGLVVGDLVSVTGRVQEFSGSTEIAGGPTYTKIGHDDTAMPTPYDLTANPPNTDPGSGICTGTGTGIVVPSADGQTRNDGYQAANFACLDGMLVTMSHGMVNAPTYTVANSGITPSPATPNNGFFAVANTTRSFRKPGILGSDPNRTAYTTTFWGNPELIQVYYPGLNVDPSTLPVSPNMTGAGIYNGGQEITLTGVIQGYQASGSPDPTYELYPRTAADLQLIDAPTYPVAVPNPVAGKLRIGTQNALHFFNSSADGADTSQYTDTCAGTGVDDTCPTAAQYATRLSKLSSQIRNELKAPPVQVLQEVENYSVATNLAGQIAGDSGNAIQYRPYVIPGNDPGGINIAILVQNGVTVNSVSQLAKNTQSTAGCNPSFPTPCLLNDRPPVLLDATYQGYRFRVLAIYDKALSGLGTKAYVGPKRREQAEQVARIVQVLQTNGATLSGADVCTAQQNAAGTLDPTCALPITGSSSVPLIVLGDFNAYEFSDGYVDVTGTIMGTIDTSIRATDPNAANAVYVYPPSSAYVAPTPTLFDTGSTVTQAQHYSYNFGGLLQEIDHILLTAPGQNDFISLDSARGNSDISIASTTLTDSSTPQRTSDHDGQVVTLGYVVTPSTDANSTITSASALTVSKNAQPTFTITPAAGFMASVGGSCGSASPSSGTNPFTYTVNAILADCTVVVTSVALYNVTTTVSGVGGNISAPAVNPVASGASTTFTVTAASGYSVANVLGDHCTPTLQNAATNTWSTGTITQACAIAATFSANPVNGTCGSDNGKTLGAPPTNLCNAGMATALVGNGPWSWSCNGSNGGSNASCSANAAAGNALSVFGGANPISNGDNSPSMAKRTDYGPVPVGVGTTHGFTIANPAAVPAPGSVTPGAGATALAITAPALPAAVGDIVVSSIVSSNPAFTISGGTGTLAVGASIPFSITVTPTAPSTQNATITVTSNAAGTPVFTFAVTANAVIAGQATPAPMLTATMLLALMSLLAVIGHAVLRRRSVTK